MRVIFYAEPIDPSLPPKAVPDEHSECASWMTIRDLEQLTTKPPRQGGLRGEELLNWGRYLQNGGFIAPLSVTILDGAVVDYTGFFKTEGQGPDLAMPSFTAPPAVFASQPNSFQQKLITGELNGDELQNEKRWTTLIIAVSDEDEKKTRLLLLAGANASLTTHKGRTALHIAAMRSSVSIFRMLLLSDTCNPQLLDCDGKNAADLLRDQIQKEPTNGMLLKMLSLVDLLV